MCFIPADPRRGAAERFDRSAPRCSWPDWRPCCSALNQGHQWGWASWQIAALLAASVMLLAAFLAVEMRADAPDARSLAVSPSRLFGVGDGRRVELHLHGDASTSRCRSTCTRAHGLSMKRTGLLLTVQPLAMAVAAPISGTISDRIRSSLPSAIGMAILAGGTFPVAVDRSRHVAWSTWRSRFASPVSARAFSSAPTTAR